MDLLYLKKHVQEYIFPSLLEFNRFINYLPLQFQPSTVPNFCFKLNLPKRFKTKTQRNNSKNHKLPLKLMLASCLVCSMSVNWSLYCAHGRGEDSRASSLLRLCLWYISGSCTLLPYMGEVKMLYPVSVTLPSLVICSNKPSFHSIYSVLLSCTRYYNLKAICNNKITLNSKIKRYFWEINSNC